jgi:hypothetical protein
MKDFSKIVALDDAFDCYEMSKRNISKTPLFYYDISKNVFLKIKSTIKDTGIVFINSYELCSKLIYEYLNQPEMKEYKIAFERLEINKNKIVSFLWFFEHIDGCYGFTKFEILIVTKELKKWCKSNGLDYLEPEVHCVD